MSPYTSHSDVDSQVFNSFPFSVLILFSPLPLFFRCINYVFELPKIRQLRGAYSLVELFVLLGFVSIFWPNSLVFACSLAIDFEIFLHFFGLLFLFVKYFVIFFFSLISPIWSSLPCRETSRQLYID